MKEIEKYTELILCMEEFDVEVLEDNVSEHVGLGPFNPGFLWLKLKGDIECSVFLEGGSKVSCVFHRGHGLHLSWPIHHEGEHINNEYPVRWRKSVQNRVDFKDEVEMMKLLKRMKL